MARHMFVVAAAVTVGLVIASFAGPGADRETDVRSQGLEMSLTAIPEMVNYQGVLEDDSGDRVEGFVTMTFTVYDAPTGGNVLWTDTQGFIQVENVVFNVLLEIPPSVLAGPNRWLGVAVNADPEMVPRKRIVSSSYAYRSLYADDADLLDGLDASQFAGDVHSHDDRYYTETELSTNDGVVNQPADPVSWYRIKDIPSGFADGL